MQSNAQQQEETRLQALRRYNVLDTPEEPAFDRFVELARRIVGMPMSMISFVDRDRQWVKARAGTDLTETPRDDAFCEHAIRTDDVMIVPDALADPRFAGNPLVTGAHGIRFYAGAPLITPGRQRIGTLCVLDNAPHPEIDRATLGILADLARSVMTELELRREVAKRGRIVEELEFWLRLSRDVATAADFGTALDRVLAACVAETGASVCVIIEIDRKAGTLRQIRMQARPDAAAALLAAARWTNGIPIAHLGCGLAMARGQPADTGPLDGPAAAEGFPQLRRLVEAGLARQLGYPFDLLGRRFGLLLGFVQPEVPADATAFIDKLLARLRRPLHDRVREEELTRSRQALLTTILRGRLREEELDRSRALLRQSNCMLRTLRAAASAIARARDEQGFLQEVCRLVVEEGGYTACWISVAGPKPECAVRPAAQFGNGLEQLPTLSLSWADTPNGCGPTGTAIRDRQLIVCRDVQTDPRFDPWRRVVTQSGFAACASVPLAAPGEAPFGALTIYSRNPFPFESEERALLADLAQEVVAGSAVVRNRSERAAADAARRAAEDQLSRVLDAGPAVLYAGGFEDSTIRLSEVSANVERILGHSPEAVRTPGWWRTHLHPADRSAAIAEANEAVEKRHVVQNYRLATGDGSWRWIRDEMMVEAAGNGREARISGVWIDVTEQRLAEDRIHRLAFTDALTGLPNRQALYDRLAQVLNSSTRTGLHGGLLRLDLNRLKLINDLFGHAGGDEAMAEAARRFRPHLRDEDMLARFAGDEFVVLLPRLARDPAAATARAMQIGETLLDALSAQPARLRGRDYTLAARGGLTLFPVAGNSVDSLLVETDTAMRHAKTSETRRIVAFEPAMQTAILDGIALEETLRDALAGDRIELWLQDQVAPSGAVVAAEALIRLRDADGGLVQPGRFIGVAERSGLIVPIGMHMLNMVCRLFRGIGARWPDGRIAVNVSPRQFCDPDFVSDVEAVLAAHGVTGERLTFEITEGLLIDRIEDVAATMARLAGLGVRFSVDDFGTGYSSLRYLQRLPIHEVKIDRSFVSQLPEDARAAAICDATLAIARRLGLDVVAEGVETDAQAAFLTSRGVPCLQGYLFARAEPAAAWCRRHALPADTA